MIYYIITGFVCYLIGCFIGAINHKKILPKTEKRNELKIVQYVAFGVVADGNFLITSIRNGTETLWCVKDTYQLHTFNQIKESRLAEANALIEKFKTL